MILLIFADALGFHYSFEPQIRDKFSEAFQTVVPAESLLAYSLGIHTSIWTSSYINEHRKWLNYVLRFFPNREIRTSKISWVLKSAATFLKKRIYNDPERYYIPEEISPFFKKVEYDFQKPFYHEILSSLFQVLDENDVNFQFSTVRRLEEIRRVKTEGDVNVIFLDEFDSMGHTYGPRSRQTVERILRFLHEVQIMKKENKDALTVMISDHGMCEIHERMNILEKLRLLKRKGYKFGVDYLVFLDATLARFWLRNENGVVKSAICDSFSGAHGHFLSNAEMQRYKVPTDEEFGNFIFLADPGVEIFPNFFHPFLASYEKGMHGYAPSHKASYGIFAVDSPIKSKQISLLDIAPTVAEYLGLNIPKQWRGKAYDL